MQCLLSSVVVILLASYFCILTWQDMLYVVLLYLFYCFSYNYTPYVNLLLPLLILFFNLGHIPCVWKIMQENVWNWNDHFSNWSSKLQTERVICCKFLYKVSWQFCCLLSIFILWHTLCVWLWISSFFVDWYTMILTYQVTFLCR